jgi:hypothetical protein
MQRDPDIAPMTGLLSIHVRVQPKCEMP